MSSQTPDTDETVELKQPLSLWEKTKIGVTSFVKTALDYIPKGLVLSAAFTGGMMLLGSLTGWGILSGVTNLDMGGFVSRVLTTVGIVTGVVGAIGAYQGVKAHNDYREKEIELQEKLLLKEKQRARLRQQQQGIGNTMEIQRQSDLPLLANKPLTGPVIGG